MYQGATCRVVHCGQLSEAFELLTGGKQGCQLTPIMFLMLIDWIMSVEIECVQQENEIETIQLKCEAIIVVWVRNLEIYKGTDQQNPSIYKTDHSEGSFE